MNDFSLLDADLDRNTVIDRLKDMNIVVNDRYNDSNYVTLFEGDCLDLLDEIPDGSVDLIITSPPYNIGKAYESKIDLEIYYKQQKKVIDLCVNKLKSTGSICWQVGNYVSSSSIVPLDTFLYPIFQDNKLIMRNRIIWHFEHGLHSKKRFSGRYETVIWFTKSDNYYFNLDPVRIPQKYPGKKHYKGPKAGQYSSNPLGKNPGDFWTIPNVKNNHVEKTLHPCQFPVELIERLVLSMSREGGIVFDPFLGVGTTAVAALKNNRRVVGSDIEKDYIDIAFNRIYKLVNGILPIRPMNKPVYDPSKAGSVGRSPFEGNQ